MGKASDRKLLKYRNSTNVKEYPNIIKVGTFANKNKNLKKLMHVDKDLKH